MVFTLSLIKRLLLIVLIPATVLSAQDDPVSRSWNQPLEPFRVAGNVYYVGASDITSFLITSPSGHILIDGGFKETAGQIRRNIAKLGFRETDVRVLLNSHAHMDHAGGLAELKTATGARLLASAEDIPLLARGGLDDPQFGDRLPFPRVYADGIVTNNEKVRIGDAVLTAHLTPGHTRGCTTWSTTVRDDESRLDIIFLCSMSVPSEYRLISNPRYPEAVEDYRKHFRFLRSITPDIYLASHGNFFRLSEKMKRMSSDRQNPFVDPVGYAQLVSPMEKRFESAVIEQTASRPD